ncbi:MAG: response regulator [Candidatus Eremiobacteraeota bacterium]|nr:response regulator [Candidatus Eremiobacteraeota bacterium]MBC5827243.1 response regulator [Candidatus Eremiobacteraeota bacterium]
MPKTILLVDDSVVQSFAVKVRLERSGYHIISAQSGAKALEIIAREPVDLVISDILMPGMDGYELCRQIKANPGGANTPVVVMSALGETTDANWRQTSGADRYLAKPLDHEELARVIEELIGVGEGQA